MWLICLLLLSLSQQVQAIADTTAMYGCDALLHGEALSSYTLSQYAQASLPDARVHSYVLPDGVMIEVMVGQYRHVAKASIRQGVCKLTM